MCLSSLFADAYSAYGCLTDVITLSCDDGKTIEVTSADYGKYAQTCDSDCCSPQADDCTELVEENRPADWVLLKASDSHFINLADFVVRCDRYQRNSIFLLDI